MPSSASPPTGEQEHGIGLAFTDKATGQRHIVARGFQNRFSVTCYASAYVPAGWTVGPVVAQMSLGR